MNCPLLPPGAAETCSEGVQGASAPAAREFPHFSAEFLGLAEVGEDGAVPEPASDRPGGVRGARGSALGPSQVLRSRARARRSAAAVRWEAIRPACLPPAVCEANAVGRTEHARNQRSEPRRGRSDAEARDCARPASAPAAADRGDMPVVTVPPFPMPEVHRAPRSVHAARPRVLGGSARPAPGTGPASPNATSSVSAISRSGGRATLLGPLVLCRA